MAFPSITKFRKFRKVKPSGIASSSHSVAFGLYGLKVTEPCRIKENHIETSRRIISKSIKSKGRYWIRVFPQLPVTKKPSDVRMGNGKGSVEFWVASLSAGNILFEIDGVTRKEADEIFKKVSLKLPVKTKVTARHFYSN